MVGEVGNGGSSNVRYPVSGRLPGNLDLGDRPPT